MGYAARANTTVRDGQKPARLATPTPTRVSPLEVFKPTARPVVDAKGEPVLGPGGRQRVHYGFLAAAAPGAPLTDEHYFDGVAIRRFGKMNGRDAKRQRIAARRAAVGADRS